MQLLVKNRFEQRFKRRGESIEAQIEWSGAIAPGADIFFVFTGSSTNFGVFDSLQYAIDEKIGTIVSISYGACEPTISASNASAVGSPTGSAISGRVFDNLNQQIQFHDF